MHNQLKTIIALVVLLAGLSGSAPGQDNPPRMFERDPAKAGESIFIDFDEVSDSDFHVFAADEGLVYSRDCRTDVDNGDYEDKWNCVLDPFYQHTKVAWCTGYHRECTSYSGCGDGSDCSSWTQTTTPGYYAPSTLTSLISDDIVGLDSPTDILRIELDYYTDFDTQGDAETLKVQYAKYQWNNNLDRWDWVETVTVATISGDSGGWVHLPPIDTAGLDYGIDFIYEVRVLFESDAARDTWDAPIGALVDNISMEVVAQASPTDLYVDAWPTEYGTQGTALTFDITLGNYGDTSNPCQLAVWKNTASAWGTPTQIISVPALTQGQTMTQSITVPYPAGQTQSNVFFELDYDNAPANPTDPNFNNNTATTTVIWEQAYVDLEVESLAPIYGNSGLPETVDVTVRNNGDASQGALLRVWYNMEDPVGNATTTVAIPPLANNASTTLQVTVLPPSSKESWKTGFHVYADPLTNHDSYLSNNTQSTDLTWFISNRPIILIAGFMGTQVEKNGNDIWGPSLYSIFRSLYGGNQRIDRDTDTVSEVESGYITLPDILRGVEVAEIDMRHFTADQLGVTAYETLFGSELIDPDLTTITFNYKDFWKEILEELQADGYQEGIDVFVCPYDWRSSLNPGTGDTDQNRGAHLLRDLIESPALANHPGKDRLTVVSHSMGGLVTQSYLKWMTDLSLDPGIHEWIVLGTPFQGSMEALMTLNGHNPTFEPFKNVPGLSREEMCTRVQALGQNLAALWQLLPTDDYEANCDFYGAPRFWPEGEGIAVKLVEVPGPFPGLTEPVYDYVSYPLQTIIDEDYAYYNPFGTVYNQAALDKRTAFLGQGYMPASGTGTHAGLATVDKIIVIAGRQVPTVERVFSFSESQDQEYWRCRSYPQGMQGQLLDTSLRLEGMTGYVMGAGDGTVHQFSATGINQAAGNVTILYRDRSLEDPVDHQGLLLDEEIGRFISDHISTGTEEYWQYSLDDSKVAFEPPPFFSMEFRLKAAVYYNGYSATEIPVFPVQMLLVDRDTREFLVGDGVARDMSGNELISGTVIHDDNFRVIKTDNQVTIVGGAHEPGRYRLFLRPSLEFWCPGCDTPGFIGTTIPEEQDFLILGHLVLEDSSESYTFPGSPEVAATSQRLEFNRIRNLDCQKGLGFSAYVDFDIDAFGSIRPPDFYGDAGLVLKVDSDASGKENLPPRYASMPITKEKED